MCFDSGMGVKMSDPLFFYQVLYPGCISLELLLQLLPRRSISKPLTASCPRHIAAPSFS